MESEIDQSREVELQFFTMGIRKNLRRKEDHDLGAALTWCRTRGGGTEYLLQHSIIGVSKSPVMARINLIQKTVVAGKY